MFSKSQLVHITRHARSLAEHLNAERRPLDAPTASGELAECRVRGWAKLLAGSGDAPLCKRLAWDGLQLPAVRERLGTVPVEAPADLPDWARTLDDVLDQVSWSTEQSSTTRAALPFQHVFIPMVRAARCRLEGQVANGAAAARRGYQLLSPAALADLEYGLLKQLLGVSLRALDQQFVQLRAARPSIAGAYQSFVSSLRGAGMVGFFVAYPTLARLCGTAIAHWTDATYELVSRLGRDLPALCRELLDDSTASIAELEAFCGDPHNGGRTVTILRFESGCKLVYKPSPARLERPFGALLEWCNQRGLSVSLRAPRAIHRAGYAWLEFIEHAPCQDRESVERYYRRAGMLLALAYVLRGTDMHHGNLISCGEHPMLVDVETLLSPPLQRPILRRALRRSARRCGSFKTACSQPGSCPSRSTRTTTVGSRAGRPAPPWSSCAGLH